MKVKEKMVIVGLVIFALILGTNVLIPIPVNAGEKVVLCNWGGRDNVVQRECWYDSFEKETGIKVITTSPPVVAKIKAQVDSGNIEWDLLITDIPAIITLTEEGTEYLEPLDYSKLDPKIVAQIIPETKLKYSIGGRIYSFNICYNTNTFPKGHHPKTWADVWDVKKFPGVRSFPNPYGGIPPQYEVFLMADGVPMDKLYPIDVERAWRSADRIKPYISKWYKSHSQVLQMLISGEVDVACTLGPYATMHKWEGAPVDVEYNQGKLASDNWCIIKGARHKEAAYKLINYMLDAKRQACYVSKVPHGPTNMESIKYVDPEIRKDLNTSPQNRAKAYWHNVRWWAELGPGGKSNRQKAIERYNKWLVK